MGSGRVGSFYSMAAAAAAAMMTTRATFMEGPKTGGQL